MKMVPRKMKDAAYGMGCTRTQVIWKIVLPTGAAGHPHRRDARRRARRRRNRRRCCSPRCSATTGCRQPAASPTASLAVLIYNFSGMPFDNQIELAWAASLVLVLIVLVFNIAEPSVRHARNTDRSTVMTVVQPLKGEAPARPASAQSGDLAIDCKRQTRSTTATSWPSATATCRSRKARSPASSARRAAARAPCCAASTA